MSHYVTNCIMTGYFLKLHAPHVPHGAEKIPIRRKCLVQKSQSKETRRVAHSLMECPAFPREPKEPLTLSGRVKLHILHLDFGFC